VGVNIHNIAKTFVNRRSETRAIADVTFRVEDNEFLCVVGPSGCGKSTLLKIIAELTEPTSGEISFDQTPPEGGIRCAMVFQEPALLPWMTVVENAAFGLEMLGIQDKEARAKARAYVEKMGLGEFFDSYPKELSGGMLQRVAIARATLADPQILLLDEPYGALDAQTRLVLQEELLRIWEEHQKTVVYVTHDIEEALLLADRVVVLSGRPAHVGEIMIVPEPRSMRRSPPAWDRILARSKHIWRLIEDEVREELHYQQG
jgi:NitT/TauT family transport system ATP-binding protein